VTQTLFTATLVSDVIPKLVQRDPEEGARQLNELRQLTRGALAEMRTLLLELRPATLIEVGGEELLRQLTEAARGRARIPIDLAVQIASPLPPEVKVAFYYIAQEALNNVIKHARAHHVTVTCHVDDDGALLSVLDDGQGFDPYQVTAEHLGLAIMRERAESIAGALDIESAAGRGTTVRVRWPAGGVG
jgi:signal transduction histidine kinase